MGRRGKPTPALWATPPGRGFEEGYLSGKGLQDFIPVVVALFLGRASVGNGENGRVEQSFALVQLCADAVNRTDRAKGIDHFIRNKIKALVFVWRFLERPDLLNRFGKAVRDKDIIVNPSPDTEQHGPRADPVGGCEIIINDHKALA